MQKLANSKRPTHRRDNQSGVWVQIIPPFIACCLVFFVVLSLCWHPESARDIQRFQVQESTGLVHSQQLARDHIKPAQKLIGSDVKLLLASHNRLLWYVPEDGGVQVLHETEGVHYGTFPGQSAPDGSLKTVWFVLRPHNWHPRSVTECLVELDLATGQELQRKETKTRFTHDAVRLDGDVFLCSTEAGQIVHLRFPHLNEVNRWTLFSRQQHINSLSPVDEGSMWVMLHNRGASSLALVDLKHTKDIKHVAEDQQSADQAEAGRAKLRATITGVGTKSHGVVQWRGWLLFLDSEGGALCKVAATAGTVLPTDSTHGPKQQQANQGQPAASHGKGQSGPHTHVQVIYKVPDSGKFLKGLAVIDDVAYFGINIWSARQSRDSPASNAEVAAVNLLTGSLLWRRKVPTHGLLNIISAPQLAEYSTYKAVYRQQQQRHIHGPASQPVVTTSSSHITDYPPAVGGHWPSGEPYMDLSLKDTDTCWKAGLYLHLTHVNVAGLKAAVSSIPVEQWSDDYQRQHNAMVEGRDSNMNKFKPGTSAMFLMFSDSEIKTVYQYPFYDKLSIWLEPMLEQVLGPGGVDKVVRMQLARMPPDTTIHMHRDMGGFAGQSHRIHIPLATDQDVIFQVCPGLDRRVQHPGIKDSEVVMKDDCQVIPMSQGMVFELNNRVLHRVVNLSPHHTRIQLVVDVAKAPKPRYRLLPDVHDQGSMKLHVKLGESCTTTASVCQPAQCADARSTKQQKHLKSIRFPD